MSWVILLDTRLFTHRVNVTYESHSRENLTVSVSKRTLLFIVSRNNGSKMVTENFRVRNSPSFPKCVGWAKSCRQCCACEAAERKKTWKWVPGAWERPAGRRSSQKETWSERPLKSDFILRVLVSEQDSTAFLLGCPTALEIRGVWRSLSTSSKRRVISSFILEDSPEG